MNNRKRRGLALILITAGVIGTIAGACKVAPRVKGIYQTYSRIFNLKAEDPAYKTKYAQLNSESWKDKIPLIGYFSLATFSGAVTTTLVKEEFFKKI